MSAQPDPIPPAEATRALVEALEAERRSTTWKRSRPIDATGMGHGSPEAWAALVARVEALERENARLRARA